MRINQVKKAQKDQDNCGGCSNEIKRGDSYSWVKPRYGAKKVRCATCVFRSSALTSGKLSGVYAAQEDCSDNIDNWDADNADDLRSHLEDMKDRVQEVADEYRESADAIHETFSESTTADECEEKAEELEGWVGDIESTMDEIEDWEVEVEEPEDSLECPMCGKDSDLVPGMAIYRCGNEDCKNEFEADPKDDEEEEKDADGRTKEEWSNEMSELANNITMECPL